LSFVRLSTVVDGRVDGVHKSRDGKPSAADFHGRSNPKLAEPLRSASRRDGVRALHTMKNCKKFHPVPSASGIVPRWGMAHWSCATTPDLHTT
jgi:hypothetical protein